MSPEGKQAVEEFFERLTEMTQEDEQYVKQLLASPRRMGRRGRKRGRKGEEKHENVCR